MSLILKFFMLTLFTILYSSFLIMSKYGFMFLEILLVGFFLRPKLKLNFLRDSFYFLLNLWTKTRTNLHENFCLCFWDHSDFVNPIIKPTSGWTCSLELSRMTYLLPWFMARSETIFLNIFLCRIDYFLVYSLRIWVFGILCYLQSPV